MTAHRHARRPPPAPRARLFALPLLLALVVLLRPPRASAPPPPAAAAPRDLVVVTAANWMYRDFLHNFKCNLERLRLRHTPVVYALDVRTHNLSHHLGLSSVLLTKQLGDDVAPGAYLPGGPRSFNDITKKKLKAVLQALRSGLDVLLSDADIFWCGDPVAYLRQVIMPSADFADADVLIQPEAKYRTLNSGFYLVKSNRRTLALFEALMDNVNIGAHDQDVVNAVFCDPKYGGAKIDDPYAGVPYRCESRGAVIRVLPSHLFPSGAERYAGKKVFEIDRDELRAMCDRGEYVILHNNFIRATKKKARLVVKGMWFAGVSEDGQMFCLDEPAESDASSLRTCGKYC